MSARPFRSQPLAVFLNLGEVAQARPLTDAERATMASVSSQALQDLLKMSYIRSVNAQRKALGLEDANG
jgi:hypothetical protein